MEGWSSKTNPIETTWKAKVKRSLKIERKNTIGKNKAISAANQLKS
jgi:hypothetical protein